MIESTINLLDHPFAVLSQEENLWAEEYQDFDDLYDDGYYRKIPVSFNNTFAETMVHPLAGKIKMR